MKYVRAKINIEQPSGFRLNVDILAKQGEITALYGPSGSGKSSILRLIAGLDGGYEQHNGQPAIEITTDNQVWTSSNEHIPTHLRGVGFVFQQAQLFPHLSVRGNLEFALRRKHQPTEINIQQVTQWLGLDNLINKPISQLSGGEIQRVAIARVLLNGARVLLMDEPLGALDLPARKQILPYIDQLHQKLDIPFIYVSHAIEEVTYLADQIYLLKAGAVVKSGTTFALGSSIELNQSEGDAAAAVIKCSVSDFDNQYNITKLNFEGQDIFVSGDRRAQQSDIKVRVPARDVSLALVANTKSSILNIIHGEIDQIHQDLNETSALIRIKVGAQYILSRITRRSVDHLNLKPQQKIFAQIKSVGLLSE
ncbi:MAG: molybdenum ABC transporter ATP-binding protein [Pseudomonadales bacterium]|nr:molybdenum ABC transporter ATP-binding protein [Pseudomonadales bacterium]